MALGNAVGVVGGNALLSTFNYHNCPREILLHSCTYPENTSHQIKDHYTGMNLIYDEYQTVGLIDIIV